MDENLFQRLSNEDLSDLVTENDWPVYVDGEYVFYKIDGKLVVMSLEEHAEIKTAHSQKILDQAVLEAGFSTEELRASLHDLYDALYVRMLQDPIHGFTHGEYVAMKKAKRLLGLD